MEYTIAKCIMCDNKMIRITDIFFCDICDRRVKINKIHEVSI